MLGRDAMKRTVWGAMMILAACTVAEPRDSTRDQDSPRSEDLSPGRDAATEDAPSEGFAHDPEVTGGDDVALDPEGATADSQDAFLYPDPAFVHVRRSLPWVRAPDPYTMDAPRQYRTLEALPGLDVRALSLAAGRVWVGSGAGLFVFDEESDRFVRISLGTPWDELAVYDLSRGVTGQGEVIVVQPGGMHGVRLSDSLAATVRTTQSFALEFASVEVGSDEVWVSPAAGGLWRVEWQEGQEPLFEQVLDAGTGLVRDIAVDASGVVWLATNTGLKHWDGLTLGSRTAWDGSLLDNDVRAITALPDGGVVAATLQGLSLLTPLGPTLVPAGIGGLPTNEVRAVECDGSVCLVGHHRGATFLEWSPGGTVGNVHHYVSQRWLPSDEVRAVALDLNNRLWIGTSAGVARIDWVAHSFAEKAEYMEALQEAHFWRLGFVPSDVWTDDAWNPTKWRTWDHDNDGLWTQMQIGAWCYAYAVTKDERYYAKARRAMDMMFLQIDIPAVDFEAAGLGRGFITRSLVRDDEGEVFESKKTQKNWHLVHWTDGHDYYWKDDTSSDETTGHFFGFPLFYDLCAKDDEERQAVAEHAGALARYIVRHGFRLLDLDGEPTTFGHWEPERLAAAVDGLEPCLEKAMLLEDATAAIQACFGSWYGEGWLNSVEILGHLLAAWHMTGDPEFYDAYDRLITTHRYDEIAMPHEETVTITDPAFMNHSDHELAMLAYHTLIRYEPNEERRQKWIEGMMFLYDYERGERNPLWAAIVALTAGPEAADLDLALQSLREMPFDRRDWRMDNSHRKDALDWPDERFGKPQFDRVFPYDEIRTVWWNSNFRVKVHGGDGREVSGPMAWLLPYWALRYAGVIGE